LRPTQVTPHCSTKMRNIPRQGQGTLHSLNALVCTT
jgi:hypothetical protein